MKLYSPELENLVKQTNEFKHEINESSTDNIIGISVVCERILQLLEPVSEITNIQKIIEKNNFNPTRIGIEILRNQGYYVKTITCSNIITVDEKDRSRRLYTSL